MCRCLDHHGETGSEIKCLSSKPYNANMPKLESITRTPSGPKAFVAKFKMDSGRSKTVRFGTSSNYALNPKKTDADRAAYLARHKVNENWSDPTTAGALSRFILWGQSRSWQANMRSYKRRFKL